MNWEDVLHRYREYQRAAGLSNKTVEDRESVLRGLAAKSGAYPQRITHLDMIDYLNRPHHRTGESVSPGTKQTERSYFQSWSRWMHLEGYLGYDPAEKLPRVKVPRREARPVQLSHIQALLECGVRQRTRDYITILSNTGLRIGEVVKIQHADYDWHTHSFSSVRKGGIIQTMHAKEAVREIAERLSNNGSEWWFPSPYKNSQFPDGDGHVLMKSASQTITNAMRRIGIKDTRITTHSIRHFYACTLLARGVPVQVVQKLLGHASLATTQLYTQINEAEIRQALNLLPYIGDGMNESYDFW